MKNVSSELPRLTLGVVFILLLIVACVWTLRPFIAPSIWAAILVIATWTPMRKLQATLGNRRWLAVTVMTSLMVLPVMLIAVTLIANIPEITEATRAAAAWRPSAQAPEWLGQLPMVGTQLASGWERVVAAGSSGVLGMAAPHAGKVARWLLSEAGDMGWLMVQFVLTIVMVAVFYAAGENWVAGLRRLAHQLAGDQGTKTLDHAGAAIRGVALGVGVTALLQSLAAGLGLFVAGIPMAGFLTLVILGLCLAQVGPMLVLLPAAGWLLHQGDMGWGGFLLVWALLVGTIDNFIRPVLIRFGADLPLLLIFAGVVGGLMAFGLVGVFMGPVILAVAYTLLQAWTQQKDTALAVPADVIAIEESRSRAVGGAS